MQTRIGTVRHASPMILLLTAVVLATATGAVQAQTYTSIDLTPNSPLSTANGISTGGAAGYSADTASFGAIRATFWEDANQIDLHPAFLDDPVKAVKGRSSVQGSADALQVGWGAGPGTNNRSVPLVWTGTAASATTLPLPFDNAGGQALATDDSQIVGYGTPLIKDGTAFGPPHAVVWDAMTQAAIDLGDAGNGAQAIGVGGGLQVGYVIKGTANAALWSGSAKSLLVLHPKDAAASVAYGTDGVLQVGYSGYDIRVRSEAPKGNKDKRFNFATVWSGTAASALVIHPYPFTHSYAAAVNGPWIAGYAGDDSKRSTPAYYHAIVWDSTNYQPTDLNTYLPAAFVGSQAFSVDAQGNVAGVALTADGQRHAVVWMLDPAQ
ncbi:hypothetical protein [Methylomicrobium lacus]|uniref:hypothetical protein n=1 Tax=Methylomicrobium lacus TaxID=136992 RepID=UPI0035A96C64